MQADQAVGRGSAEGDADLLLEGGGGFGPAVHDRDDVGVEIDGVAAGRNGGEEMVERGHPFHLDPGDPQGGGDRPDGVRGNVSELGLDVAQDVDQASPIPAMAGQNGFYDSLGHLKPRPRV